MDTSIENKQETNGVQWDKPNLSVIFLYYQELHKSFTVLMRQCRSNILKIKCLMLSYTSHQKSY